MAWRGQGGRRAKGRRGDQDARLDNTAWLAVLEREAAGADAEDEDEDVWASSLRGRREPGTAARNPKPPGRAEAIRRRPGDSRLDRDRASFGAPPTG